MQGGNSGSGGRGSAAPAVRCRHRSCGRRKHRSRCRRRLLLTDTEPRHRVRAGGVRLPVQERRSGSVHPGRRVDLRRNALGCRRRRPVRTGTRSDAGAAGVLEQGMRSHRRHGRRRSRRWQLVPRQLPGRQGDARQHQQQPGARVRHSDRRRAVLRMRTAAANCTKTPVACGARAGDTLRRHEFCAYLPSGWCGAADAASRVQAATGRLHDAFAERCAAATARNTTTPAPRTRRERA